MIDSSELETMSVSERLQVMDQLWGLPHTREMEDNSVYVYAILDLRREPLDSKAIAAEKVEQPP